MRQKVEGEKNRFMRTACILLILVLISTWFVCGLYARFKVEESGGDGARVASFVFTTGDGEGRHYLNLSDIQKPGDIQTYTFTVSNKNGSRVSEVAEKYKFAVQLNGSMPLECTISGGERNAEVLTAEITDSTEALPVRSGPKDAGQLPASEECTRTYKLTVQWPSEANNAKYASRSAVAEVILTVTAEQID